MNDMRNNSRNDTAEARPFEIGRIPEMARPVGLHGALAQAEVGGSACFAVIVAIAHPNA
jgi:hypothetical protein